MIFLTFGCMLIGFGIRTRRDNERTTETMEQKLANGENELPFEETSATVFPKHADIDPSSKYHRQVYAAEFLTDNGEHVTLEITEEIFQSIEIRQKGLLITLRGKFYDFGDGSDV